jgi:(S)-2-hydroxy-acid oxidase
MEKTLVQEVSFSVNFRTIHKDIFTAAGNCGIPFVLSTTASSSAEEVTQSAPNAIKWFQTYIFRERNVTEELVRRAEKAGYKALVISVDAPVFGIRRKLLKHEFLIPKHLSFANFGEKTGKKQFKDFHNIETNTWEDVKWLVSFTKLPVVLKGILTKEDAELAVRSGVAGIMVSNHGARQLDGVPATIEALPEVVEVVSGRIPVFLDGGVRQGTDLFKALALGAKMVFLGRSTIYGLAVNGQQGVEDVINIMKKEFDIAFCLAGCRKISDISRDMVAHESQYAKL